jgi:hypothetical protein
VNLRANLRHAGTPVEAPINSSFTAKRVGQPTIGVPADKMAEFLNEMKSVRLKKVFNAPADMGRLPPRVVSTGNSFIAAGIQRPPRPVEGTVTVGEKRKRQVDTLAKDDLQSVKRRLMGPLPRSADSSFRSTNSSFSQSQSQSQSSQSQSQSQSQSEAGPSKLTRSFLPVRAWPSSSVDGTDVTPSLTSDGDAEQVPDEPSPPTPPQLSAVVIQGPDEAEEALLQSPPRPDPEEVTRVPRPPTPPRRNRKTSAQSKFDKCPPLSPLPAPSPRKTRPPSRTVARPLIAEDPDVDDEDEEDDPLASAAIDSPSPLAAAAARTRRKQNPATTMTTGPPRQTRNRGNASTVQSGGASSKARRRRLTLDEELRNSDGVTEDDLRALDIEPHVLTAVGRRRQKGFLAHGGGAGAPIVVDVEGHAFDYDEGTEEEDEDDVEIIEPPPPPPPPLLQRKPKGRAVVTSRRR